jgi:hypothetical protein
VVIDKREDSSKSENKRIPARRLVRDRRPIERYLQRDSSIDEESD